MNFTSVSIKGTFNLGRARVLWRDGLLRVYSIDGLIAEYLADQPVKRPHYLHTWDVRLGQNGDAGMITLRMKCITCGGRKWWAIAYMPLEKLWRTGYA
jgi:hypothetical protein